MTGFVSPAFRLTSTHQSRVVASAIPREIYSSLAPRPFIAIASISGTNDEEGEEDEIVPRIPKVF